MKFIQDNIFLIAVAFMSGAMLVWPLVRRGAGGAVVNTLQATMLINKEDALILDVREPAEFNAGHILNARNIPLGELDKRAGELSKWKDKPIVVSCASGNRSGSAVGTLKKQGFTRAVNLAGGFGAWRQAGLPIGRD
jgi:rhodanese-related sulfurtransferase